MANDEFRDQQQASREVGLKARHETRVERAIRREVAEEIAQAIEAKVTWFREMYEPSLAAGCSYGVEIAREIGARP